MTHFATSYLRRRNVWRGAFLTPFYGRWAELLPSARLSVDAPVRSKKLWPKSSFLDRRRQTRKVCFRRSSRSWRKQLHRNDASEPLILAAIGAGPMTHGVGGDPHADGL